jgi:hypothetical protein
MQSILAILLAILCSAAPGAEASYYENEHALFSKRPPADKAVSHLTRVGTVGISLDLLQLAFTMRIKAVEPESPAAAAKLAPGMIIESINGRELADIDPRIQLGNWITEAEAGDGRLVMRVANQPGGETREVVVEIPVLGTYSETWPVDCPKSAKIVRNFAEFLKQPGANQGFADIGMLFLLSTAATARNRKAGSSATSGGPSSRTARSPWRPSPSRSTTPAPGGTAAISASSCSG